MECQKKSVTFLTYSPSLSYIISDLSNILEKQKFAVLDSEMFGLQNDTISL
jgi:hypothetical protein